MSKPNQTAIATTVSAPRRSFLRDRGPAAPAAYGHGLCVRPHAATDADSLAARFTELSAVVAGSIGAPELFPGEPRMWTEWVSVGAGDPAADRCRRRELARPVVPYRDAPVRGVLLCYPDGATEVVLTTHRAVLDHGGLVRFAAVLLDSGPIDPQWPADPVSEPDDRPVELPDAEFDPLLDWGLGSAQGRDAVGSHEVRLADDHPAGEAASWLAAVGLVLARYESLGRPAVSAVLADPVSGFAGLALVPVDADPAGTLGAVADRVRARFAAGPAWHTDQLGEVRTGVGVIVEDLNLPGPGLPGGSVVAYLPCLRPPFPVTITVGRDGARCDHELRHCSAEAAARFVRHVVRAHALLCNAPDTRTDRIPLLTEEEVAAVVELGRPASAPAVPPCRIDAVLAEVAARAPDAIAVTFGEQRISYRELDRRANRLAHGLRALNVRDGDRVGVCLERSADLVVALLAVLRSGAAYVPMDPAYPHDRLAYTTEDASVAAVITDKADFPTPAAARVITVADLAALGGDRCTAPETGTGGTDPAYVIYTSGSTGRPKGVVVPHVNVLSLMAATTEDFGLGSADVWTVFHSSAFDFSVWEVWGSLLTGGRLVVVPYWVSRSPVEFHQLLVAERVSVLSQTPSAFAHLIEVDRDEAVRAPVRLVVFGGEGLDPGMLLRWFDRHPETECRMVNMYGITETTVHVTAQTVTRAMALAGSRSVGLALPGWWLRVNDPHGRPQPVGVAGEIYVGGAGLALHYLNRPELTEQRFLTDPITGERMYRSGDKGRLLPDGRLEHLGRLDSQVKIRGFRIELDEIRAVLLDDPRVTAAAVVLNQDDPADSATARLDAYAVLDIGDSDDTAAAVRHRAARFLPEYMVPATVTVITELPLTVNGKLDLAKLPAPRVAPSIVDKPAPGREAPARANTDELASALLETWQEVLGVPVGLDDNFFDLGGNSLYAMRVGAALRKRGGVRLVMRDLYLRPTIRQLTEAARQGG